MNHEITANGVGGPDGTGSVVSGSNYELISLHTVSKGGPESCFLGNNNINRGSGGNMISLKRLRPVCLRHHNEAANINTSDPSFKDLEDAL